MTKFDSFEQAEVQEWRNGFSVLPGVLETVAHWVGFNQLMTVLKLLWPTFVEVEGCVLLPWEYQPETFEDWQTKYSSDLDRVEGTLNHLHLWDVFDPDRVPADGLLCLGEVLAKAWSAALQEQFPNRTFKVELSNSEEDYGPTVYIRS